MPVTAVTFLIGAAALAGIVPLSGFFSKDEVLLAVLDHRNPAFIVVTLAAVALSALYMARLAFVVFFGRLRPANEDAHESSLVMTVPLVLLAFFALTVGFLAIGWTDDYQGFGNFLGSEETGFEVGWLTVVSLALALSGVVVGWLVYVRGSISHEGIVRRYPRAHRLLVGKYYVDEVYQWAIDRVVLALGRFVAVFRPDSHQRYRSKRLGHHGLAVGASGALHPDRPHVQLRYGDGAGGRRAGSGLVDSADVTLGDDAPQFTRDPKRQAPHSHRHPRRSLLLGAHPPDPLPEGVSPSGLPAEYFEIVLPTSKETSSFDLWKKVRVGVHNLCYRPHT